MTPRMVLVLFAELLFSLNLRLKFRAEDIKERSVCYKQGAFASQKARSIALDSDWRAELKSAM